MALALFAGPGACLDHAAGPPGHGARVAVDVAALDLQGVGDVVWDVEVVNGAATPEVVWQRRLTSSGYGDGAGSASYVGPCDADAADNTVRVWVVGIYSAAVSDAGAFAAGSDTGLGAVVGDPLAFQNPTASGPLERTITCRADADTEVQLDVSLLRPAQQGFFDITVSFGDVFCSAKLDCEDDAGGDLELLHNLDTGTREMTAVLGFACTSDVAGPTYLYMDDARIDCTGFPTAPILVDAASSGRVDLAGPFSANADGYLFAAAVYRGVEQLGSKAYWNLSLGLDQTRFAAAGDCVFTTRATVVSAPLDVGPAGFELPADQVYPVIDWVVPLSDAGGRVCTRHQVDQPDSGVYTTYVGYLSAPNQFTWAAAPVAFPIQFDRSGPSTARACVPECSHGGVCADGLCECPSGWEGPACETQVILASCEDYRGTPHDVGDGDYLVDPDGDAGADPPFTVYCVMSTVPAGDFLTLPTQGSNKNFSRRDGAASPTGCGTVSGGDPGGAYSYYEKLRINPATRVITTSDRTFATQIGQVRFKLCATGALSWNTWLNYGVAWDSYDSGSHRGTANIDLTGTPFIVSTASTFINSGYLPAGTTSISGDRKIVNLTGGGHSGQRYASYLKLDFAP
ncbi:MAG: hypothetical protein EP329_00775 [Deltaproteobacteria bacterium]|nr:MAG: hypothetical protein EP329_00775 [Deltaproteobacteria bacterium]